MTTKEAESCEEVIGGEEIVNKEEESLTQSEKNGEDEPEVCTKISEKVKVAGFLDKKGSMLWKRYWFVLEDKLLLYYKSQLEYLNLSPCRGSLNMNLVSAVQPRRNSKEPIIHIVSRTQTLVLKATDRPTQEKWLQALLDSIGKQGMASLRFSLDDLPGEVKTMTLPKRLYSGSLDAVWKPPVIPKTPMLDKVMAYEEDADENQNTDPYSSLNSERKSLTLDNRRMDTLNKLRSVMGKRKNSVTTVPEPKKLGKQRKESFLRKMFKRKHVKEEESAPETEEIKIEIDEVESVKPAEQESPRDPVVQESDGEDPLYDKIDHSKDTEKKKENIGFKTLMPEGTLAELKDRLRSKESLHEPKEPPALPPRSFSNSQIALEVTTEVIVHHTNSMECEESEESETSGHYQVIGKPPKEVKESEKIETEKPVEAEYQVVKKKSSRVSIQIEEEVIAPVGDQVDEKKESQVSEENGQACNGQVTVEAEYQVIRKKSSQISVQNEAEIRTPAEADHQEKDQQEEDIQPPVEVAEKKPSQNGEDEIRPPIEAEYQVINKDKKSKSVEESGDTISEELSISESPVEPSAQQQELLVNVRSVPENEPGGEEKAREEGEERDQQQEDEGAKQESEERHRQEVEEKARQEIKERARQEIEEKTRQEMEERKQQEVEEKARLEVEEGLSELNSLLERLADIAAGPLQPRESRKSAESDPDYDIPRPLNPLPEEEDTEDRMAPTDFFTQSDAQSNNSTYSLEPDSLEEKKDLLKDANLDWLEKKTTDENENHPMDKTIEEFIGGIHLLNVKSLDSD